MNDMIESTKQASQVMYCEESGSLVAIYGSFMKGAYKLEILVDLRRDSGMITIDNFIGTLVSLSGDALITYENKTLTKWRIGKD